MKKLMYTVAILSLFPLTGWAQDTAEKPAIEEPAAEEQAALQDPVISTHQAYAFATAEKQKNGTVFLTLLNSDEEERRLTGVKTDIAKSAELHMGMMEGDVMKMVSVPYINLMPDVEFVFEPSGFHIMLMDLKAPLKIGDTFTIELEFASAEPLSVPVTVVKPGETPKSKKTSFADPEEMKAHIHDHGHMSYGAKVSEEAQDAPAAQ